MDFKSLIKNARPHLKDNSINAYATSLKLLAGEETSLYIFLIYPLSLIPEILHGDALH